MLKSHVPIRTSRIVSLHFEQERLSGREVSRAHPEHHVSKQIARLVFHCRIERQFRAVFAGDFPALRRVIPRIPESEPPLSVDQEIEIVALGFSGKAAAFDPRQPDKLRKIARNIRQGICFP